MNYPEPGATFARVPSPTPRLSVIVPFYDVAPYVTQTLRSLSRNVFDGVEFLLVDDGSTDATAEILAGAAARLPGARVLTHPDNRGLSAARNTGLRAAGGDYLTFLDGDDFVAAGYYPQLLATIERLGCDMVRTDHVQVHGRTRTVRRVCFGPRGVVANPRDGIGPANRVTSVDAPNAWSGIYHRRMLESGLLSFDESLTTSEDRPWAWQIHLGAASFAVVDLLGVFYRRGVATSLTQLADERQFAFIAAFDAVIALVAADREADRFMPKAVRTYCAMVVHHLRRSDSYPDHLRPALVGLCRDALRRLPVEVLTETLRTLDPDRRTRLDAVLAA